MNDVIYQKILDELLLILPDDWSNVIFYVEYGEASYSYEYYVKRESGEYEQCFKLNNITKTDIMKSFSNIDKIIKPVRKIMSENEKWSNFTMIVNRDGKFKVEYDYSDLTENSYTYKAIWKYKYMGILPSRDNSVAYKSVQDYINSIK